MRAILISVTGVSEIEIDESKVLEDLYRHINCSTVTGAGYIGDHNMVWADDEGLYSTEPVQCVVKAAWMEGATLVGNLVVTGTDEEGNTTPCTLTLDQVREQIIVKGMRMTGATA